MPDRQTISDGDSSRTERAPEPIREEPADLHAALSEMVVLLAAAAQHQDATDAYLAACGICQIVDDWFDAAAWRSRQAVALLDGRAPAVGLLRAGVDTAAALRRLPASGIRAFRLREDIRLLIRSLADSMVCGLIGDTGEEPARAQFPALARDLIGQIRGCRLDRMPSALTSQLVRPPSSFRSFDQHPQDLVELARRFTAAHPDCRRPLTVAGVRTSGGYLAPLAAAALRAMGYLQADWVSTRPGSPLPHAAALTARAARAGGMVLVVDDPPSTGGSLAAVARSVRRRGYEPRQIVPLFAGFTSDAPKALREYPCLILPPEDWHIRKLLSRASLRAAVADAFMDREVIDVECDEPHLPGRDAHLAVRLTAHLRDGDETESVELIAEGAGTGYLGRHAVAVAAHLPGLVPTVYGFRDGVLLRSTGEACAFDAVAAQDVVDYAAARQRDLAVPQDRGALLQGRQPVWEVGARILARGFGRFGPLLRPPLIDPALRSLLRADQPCLIDGRTGVSGWLSAPAPDGGVRKTDFDEGGFSHHDLACYDAAYDLAGAAVRAPQAERDLIEGWQRTTGTRIDPARWCVYQLVHAWNLDRLGHEPRLDGQARAVRSLLGQLFVADVDAEPDGPWCVLDVDGVLELDFGGTSISTLSAMTALRALRAHRFRVLLATGRCVADVRARCDAYRLAGGVAEYGAVLYDASSGRTFDASPDSVAAAERRALIADLTSDPSVRIDPGFTRCVRASQYHETSRRATGLSPDTLRRVAAGHSGFRAVIGDAQTDFVPSNVDKASAVRRLLSLMGESATVELAVGDTAMDLGILRMARIGLAPAHARQALRGEGVQFTRSAYQNGLAQAVGRLLGHQPGGCPTCRAPRLTTSEQLVLSLLSAAQGGRRGLPAAALRLAALRRATATAAAAPTAVTARMSAPAPVPASATTETGGAAWSS
jgi:hydroxymethylpyrimidine pyrophosphatase-like HAD family hydrolase